jgi:hypothetical protein
VKFAVLFLLILVVIMSGCGGSMQGTVHAQANATPAILSAHCTSSNSSIAYMAGLGGDESCNSLTGSSNTGLPIPSAGTLQNLRVFAPQGGMVVTVFINGTASATTCTVSGSSFAFGNNCSDTTHTTAVSAGDLVSIQASKSGVSSIEFMQVSLEKQ